MYEETLKRDFQSTAPADESVLPLDDSILASWVRSICQTARGYGVVPEEIMKRSMMNVSLLSVPDARYPAVSVRNFWEQILKACGDNLLGYVVVPKCKSLRSTAWGLPSSRRLLIAWDSLN